MSRQLNELDKINLPLSKYYTIVNQDNFHWVSVTATLENNLQENFYGGFLNTIDPLKMGRSPSLQLWLAKYLGCYQKEYNKFELSEYDFNGH